MDNLEAPATSMSVYNCGQGMQMGTRLLNALANVARQVLRFDKALALTSSSTEA